MAIEGIESVAGGTEGSGQAVIFNQPDFGAANYKLASLYLDRARETRQRQNESMAKLEKFFQVPEDYFIPDQKEIMESYNQLVDFAAESIRNKKDPNDPRNYDEFKKFRELNSALQRKITASQNSKNLFLQAQENFDPTKHDAEHFYEAAKDFTSAATIDERVQKNPNFLVGKTDLLLPWKEVPNKRIPVNREDAELYIRNWMATPQGIETFTNESNKKNGAFKTPEEMLNYEMVYWDIMNNERVAAEKEKMRLKSIGKESGKGTESKEKPLRYEYSLDYVRAGQDNTDVSRAYDVVDLFDVKPGYVNSFIDVSGDKESPKGIQNKLVSFEPVAVQRDPQSGEVWFFGNMRPESKAGENLSAGSYKQVSVPLKGNEKKFKEMFAGTDLENIDQFLDSQRSSAVGSSNAKVEDQAVDAGADLAVVPTKDPVEIDLQEKIYRQAKGVSDVRVKNGKVTLYSGDGISKTFDQVKDKQQLQRLAKGEITLNQLFLNSQIDTGQPDVQVLTNPDGTPIKRFE